jgi:hypothetical protein
MSKKKLIRVVATLVVASIVGGYHYLTNNTDNNQANTKNNQSANSSRANAPSIKNKAQVLTKLAPDITLLVAHNIALAKRVPIQQGDTVNYP